MPNVVVHLAAISAPAACEADPERCAHINEPRALFDATVAHAPDARLIAFSSDQVYAGGATADRPYSERDEAAPVNEYGRSKLRFECAAIVRLGAAAIALRCSLVLGPRARGACKKATSLQFVANRLAPRDGNAAAVAVAGGGGASGGGRPRPGNASRPLATNGAARSAWPTWCARSRCSSRGAGRRSAARTYNLGGPARWNPPPAVHAARHFVSPGATHGVLHQQDDADNNCRPEATSSTSLKIASNYPYACGCLHAFL